MLVVSCWILFPSPELAGCRTEGCELHRDGFLARTVRERWELDATGNVSPSHRSIDWFKGKIMNNYRKIPYFMGKSMVSCRFSFKSTHWIGWIMARILRYGVSGCIWMYLDVSGCIWMYLVGRSKPGKNWGLNFRKMIEALRDTKRIQELGCDRVGYVWNGATRPKSQFWWTVVPPLGWKLCFLFD